MSVPHSKYLAYLLRLWKVGQNGDHLWRASLEVPRTGEKRSFASLEALMDFLREQTRILGEIQDISVKSESEETNPPE